MWLNMAASYHWSLITFGALYTLVLVGAIIARFGFDKPLPREVTAGLVALMLVLAVVRVCCCVSGTQDCPLTIGGMKQTSTLILAAIILLTLLSLDLPLASLHHRAPANV